MVTKMDPLNGNRQIFGVIIGELVIGTRKRFGYNKGFELFVNLIKTNSEFQWWDTIKGFGYNEESQDTWFSLEHISVDLMMLVVIFGKRDTERWGSGLKCL